MSDTEEQQGYYILAWIGSNIIGYLSATLIWAMWLAA